MTPLPQILRLRRYGFAQIMDMTIVVFCNLFTILILNTELEPYRIIINDSLLYWLYLIIKKKK